MVWWGIAAVCAFFVKGLCGFANTLVFSSIMGFTASNVSISPVELLLGYPANLLVAFRERRFISWRMCLPLAALVLSGNIPGMLLLKNADTGMIKALFGAVIMIVGLEMLLRGKHAGDAKQSPALLAVIGVLSGLLCGLYGVGALLGAYIGRVTENAGAFRANICVVFLMENTFRIVMYTLIGIITTQTALRAAILFPFALLGLGLGFAASGRLDDRVVRKIVIVLLIVSGAVLLFSNL